MRDNRWGLLGTRQNRGLLGQPYNGTVQSFNPRQGGLGFSSLQRKWGAPQQQNAWNGSPADVNGNLINKALGEMQNGGQPALVGNHSPNSYGAMLQKQGMLDEQVRREAIWHQQAIDAGFTGPQGFTQWVAATRNGTQPAAKF